MIKEFWAVTASGSLYHISQDNERNLPSVVKVGFARFATKWQSKRGVGDTLRGGDHVGIMRGSILLYYTLSGSDRRPPDYVPFNCRGEHTSSPVALFLNEDMARECLNSPNLEPADFRWLNETRETLEAIGKDHPYFVISETHPLIKKAK